MKLDREAKIRDLVDQLKMKIANMEKGMAGDIEKAVRNHDENVLSLKTMSDRIKEVGKERKDLFMVPLDKIRIQIKDFENHLNESRGNHDRAIIELRKEVTAQLDASSGELKELAVDRR